MKPYFGAEVSDLLKKLLKKDVKDRIGCGPTDADEIRAHPWFSDVNWEKVSKMTQNRCKTGHGKREKKSSVAKSRRQAASTVNTNRK